MPKCIIEGCIKLTRNKITKEVYCPMHKERFKRHGYFELKRERGEHGLEKLPHEIDKFIIENCKTMIDHEIANKLLELGYSGANAWNVRYRRRKLGIKKYLYGEVLKHKAWVRAQAIKSYGNKCELCDYTMAIDTHHIIPKYQGGPHKIDNLMVMCPNCHALVTRNYIKVSNRKDIPKIRLKIKGKLKTFYPS